MTATPQTTRLGDFTVKSIGLGCMGLDHVYGQPASAEQGERLLLGALDAGYDFLDTATLYGFGRNETRIGQVLKSRRSQYLLASKCGMGGVKGEDGITRRVIDGRPETLRAQCEASLQRLQTDVIDLYYLHRWHKAVPIEDSVGALADLVHAGKIRSIGLSEVSAATLKKAHAVHPIAALQTEYSLWTRNPEIAVLQACAELGVAFVAFSPVARGFLCNVRDINALDAKDLRRSMARFQAEHLPSNLALVQAVDAIAAKLGCSSAQLALAWVLHQGARFGAQINAIPGTTQIDHAHENLGAMQLDLSDATVTQLNALFTPQAVSGPRYDAQAQSEVDTEQF